MKYLKYDFSTLHKVTSFLKTKEFFGGSLIGVAAGCSLGWISPLAALGLAGGVVATSLAAPLLERGTRWMREFKGKIISDVQKDLSTTFPTLKTGVKNAISHSLVTNKQNNKEYIEKINAEALKGIISLGGDMAAKGGGSTGAISVAVVQDCLPDVEPLVQYYNLQLIRAAANVSEQHKILDNFGNALTLNMVERMCENAITKNINNPQHGCPARTLLKVMFM